MLRRFAWLPDIPDPRDHIFVCDKAPLPEAVDLRDKMSKIEDQGELGSCTAQAIAGAMEYLQNKNGEPAVDLSRLFIYYQERNIENSVRYDSGAFIRDGIKAMNKIGVCDEKLWPYDTEKFKQRPPDVAYEDAATRKISEYLRITSNLGVKRSLADGYPVIFGFTVFSSFMSARVEKTGIVKMPTADEEMFGGHAVLLVGYNDKKRRFICRNSWGPYWGQDGYFEMPYKYVGSKMLADDFWMIKK